MLLLIPPAWILTGVGRITKMTMVLHFYPYVVQATERQGQALAQHVSCEDAE